MHRIHWQGPLPAAGEPARVADDEAAHALRVKRLRVGETVELLDGLGGVAAAYIASIGGGRSRDLMVKVTDVRHVPETLPRLEVWAATPKGSRVDEMVEGLSEVGAASWTPLRSAHSIVEPRPTKLERLMRVGVESAKQSGRPWFLRIDRERPFAEAIAPSDGTLLLLADGGGTPLPGTLPCSPVEPAAPKLIPFVAVRVLIGPEGGFAPAELAEATGAGVRVTRFGPHTMRIETAAVAAAAIILDRFAAPAG